MRTGLAAHQRHQAIRRAIGTTGSNVCDLEARQRILDAHTERIERERQEREDLWWRDQGTTAIAVADLADDEIADAPGFGDLWETER